MMRRTSFLALLLVGAITACHKEGPSGPFAGHWIGQDVSSTINFDITLKDSPDGSISGGGSLYGSSITGGNIPVSLSGSESDSSCSLTMNAPPYTHADLSGTVSNNVWSAVVNGSGFSSVAITFTKQ